MRNLYFTLALLSISKLCTASTFTSTAVGGNWHSPSTWVVTGDVDADGIPDADDNVIIDANADVEIMANAECLSILMTAASVDGETSILIYDPTILTVGTNITMNTGLSSTRFTRIYISDGGDPVNPATVIVGGDLNIFSSNNVKAEIDMTNGSGILEIKGNFSLTHGTPRGSLLSSPTSKVVFSGPGTQVFPIGDGSASANKISYNDIEINNTSGTVSINTATTNMVTSSSLAGSLTLIANSIFNNGGHEIAGNGSESFTLEAGAHFIMTGTSGFPTGLLHSVASASTVEYAGAAQNVTALNNSQTYGNLTVSNGNTKTITSAIEVAGTLTLSGATTLASGGNLTLLSSASGTARIAAIPTGASITGDVTVQRFIPASNRAYRYLSAPVNNSGSIAFSQLIDNTFVTGTGGATNGFDDSPSNSSSLYTYDESASGSANSGWNAASNITSTVNSGQGISLFIRGSRSLTSPFNSATPSDDVTLDYTGTLNAGPISPSISFSGATADDGWNLVGNPYASQIDWNAASGWTKTNVSGTIYSYDPQTEVYSTWDGASSVNGGSRYIAAGQAFFIKTTGSSPVLTFDEDIKISDAPANFFRTSANSNTLKLILTSAARRDEAVIDMNNGHSSFFSYEDDALKMLNSKINISSYSSDNKNTVINRYGALASNDTLWLFVSGTAGSYQLTFSDLTSFTEDPGLVLMDKYTQTFVTVTNNLVYDFNISSDVNSFGDKRFALLRSMGPLPVTLIRFSGEKKGPAVELKWTTASETDNDRFTIERSKDGSSFEEITEEDAAKNGHQINNYISYDIHPLTGINYYRLISHDGNGTRYESKVIAVDFSEHVPLQVWTYPNPASDLLNISVNKEWLANDVLEIMDIHGRVISSVLIEKESSEIIRVNTSGLPAGIYFIHLKGTDSVKPVSFIKK